MKVFQNTSFFNSVTTLNVTIQKVDQKTSIDVKTFYISDKCKKIAFYITNDLVYLMRLYFINGGENGR